MRVCSEMGYRLTWITDQLAAGYAPMSYAELDSIREQGITAIVNLCGEFADLHEIEENSGFEVYYLPIPDESAPDLGAMEQALEWLDEAIYLKKKVLVHCRHGHGRTGTFLSAYMLRRGLSLRQTEKRLKGTGAAPTNYSQWKLLKKYGRQEGRLTLAEPSLSPRPSLDLSPLLTGYQRLVRSLDSRLAGRAQTGCDRAPAVCCHIPFDLQLVESVALSEAVNRYLPQDVRCRVIERSLDLARRLKGKTGRQGVLHEHRYGDVFSPGELRCPLRRDDRCILAEHRPVRCRLWGETDRVDPGAVEAELATLSGTVYFELTGEYPPAGGLLFSLADTLSGKFVEVFFRIALQKGCA